MKKQDDLFGVVMAGGQSKRLGRDKTLLNFHGHPQFLHLFQLLEPYFESAFLSGREDQQHLIKNSELNFVVDQFPGSGPLGGILSCLDSTQKSILTVACDMPLITSESIEYLVNNRDTSKAATIYFDELNQRIQPLFAIWEYSVFDELRSFFNAGGRSVLNFLKTVDYYRLEYSGEVFFNINTAEDLNEVKHRFNK